MHRRLQVQRIPEMFVFIFNLEHEGEDVIGQILNQFRCENFWSIFIPQDAAWRALQFAQDRFVYKSTFCVQKRQNSEWPIVAAAKVLHEQEIPFFVFHFVLPNTLSNKKEYTTSCNMRSPTIHTEQFILFVYFL